MKYLKSSIIAFLASAVVFIPTVQPMGDHAATINQALGDTEIKTKLPQAPESKFKLASYKTIPIPQSANTSAIGSDISSLMSQAGVLISDQAGFLYIFGQESGFCHTKWEGERACTPYHGVPTYAGYGICQSTPAHKMASAGSDWATNPITQIKWCYHYALEYGSIQAAVNFKKCTGSCYSPRTKNVQYKATPWF